ncbi:Nucleoside 5-triphosphatase RdgB (dHAPTP, dITP, XTP-specific) [Chitinispirillum alkaliphilum]|nr:Nucleoside 5-triphosphatase RdgB (dHAPTP, dITP, XTP-specific) [Chitinispirillum alkaliphilum]
MVEIIVASANDGKVREFREMFSSLPVRLSSLRDRWQPVPEIEETGSTFYENAKIKADWVFENSSGIWALADDSGLVVDALDGAPGVYSARFAGENASSDDNNRKLLSLLSDIPGEQRKARFVCTLVLKTAPDRYISSEGTCEGEITFQKSGTAGFGYDPIFQPQGMQVTFAEIDSEKKNQISHRGKALNSLVRELHGFFGSGS